MKPLLSSFAAGLVFGIGLAVSGMTNPAKVIQFLDVTGAWDPSLALVMGGAIAVHLLAYRFVHRMRSPMFSERFGIPTRKDIDVRLIGGASLFGVGWALGGFCPGPGIVASAAGRADAIIFFIAMTAGMLLFHIVDAKRALRTHALHEQTA